MDSRRDLGFRGEEAAARFLEAGGYEILARNVRLGRCELDIVARDGARLVFVEVKTRSGEGYGRPAEAVTPAKQRRIVQAALLFLQREGLQPAELRFDVVEVRWRRDGAALLTHIPHAFDGAGGNLFY